MSECVVDPHCIAYTTVTTKDKIFCNLYSENYIIGLKAADTAVTYFVPPCFNATFNNISILPWRSVLLVEEIGVPGENH
jgi:hypothetical protein